MFLIFLAVVTMSRFLRIPNTALSRIGKGPSLAEGGDVEQHVTQPLDPKSPIPRKTGLQKVVERPDQRILDARMKKQAGPPRMTKKRPAGDPSRRPSKRPSVSSVVVSEDELSSGDDDRTRSPSPLNII